MNNINRRNSSTAMNESHQQQGQHHQPILVTREAAIPPFSLNKKKPSFDGGSFELLNKENSNYGNIQTQPQSTLSSSSFVGRRIAGTSNVVVLKSQKTASTNNNNSTTNSNKKCPIPTPKQATGKPRSNRNDSSSHRSGAVASLQFSFDDDTLGNIRQTYADSNQTATYSVTNGMNFGSSSSHHHHHSKSNSFHQPSKELNALNAYTVQSTKNISQTRQLSQKPHLAGYPSTTKASSSSQSVSMHGSGQQLEGFFKSEYPASKKINANTSFSSKNQSLQQQQSQQFQKSIERNTLSQGMMQMEVPRKTVTKNSIVNKSSGAIQEPKKKTKKKIISSLKRISHNTQTTSSDRNTISQLPSDTRAVLPGTPHSQTPLQSENNLTNRNLVVAQFVQPNSAVVATAKQVSSLIHERNNNHHSKEQLNILSQFHQDIGQQHHIEKQFQTENSKSSSRSHGQHQYNSHNHLRESSESRHNEHGMQGLYTANTATFEVCGTIEGDEYRADNISKKQQKYSKESEKKLRSSQSRKSKARIGQAPRSKSVGKKQGAQTAPSSHNTTFTKSKPSEQVRSTNQSNSNILNSEQSQQQQYGNIPITKQSLTTTTGSNQNGKRSERSLSEGKRSGNMLNQISIDQVKKKKLQELISRQVEMQNDKHKVEKKLKQQNDNEMIRMKNAQRFQKQKASEPTIFPWGFNQQKVRLFMKDQMQREERSQERQILQQNTVKDDENTRRERLGLSFMNNLDDHTILNLKRSSQPINNINNNNNNQNISGYLQPEPYTAKSFSAVETPNNRQQQQQHHHHQQQQQLNSSKMHNYNNNHNSINTSVRMKSFEEQQYILAFMEFKKQLVEEQEREEQQIKQNEKMRIEENLKRLNATIKRQQRTSRSKSLTKRRGGESLHLSYQQQPQYSNFANSFDIPNPHFNGQQNMQQQLFLQQQQQQQWFAMMQQQQQQQQQLQQAIQQQQQQQQIQQKARSKSNGESRRSEGMLFQHQMLSQIGYPSNKIMENISVQGQEVSPIVSNEEQQQQQHLITSSDGATDENFSDRKFSILNSEFKNIISQALMEQKQFQESNSGTSAGNLGYCTSGRTAGKNVSDMNSAKSFMKMHSKESSDQKVSLSGAAAAAGVASSTAGVLASDPAQIVTTAVLGTVSSPPSHSPPTSALLQNDQINLQMKNQRIYQQFLQLENKFHSLYKDNNNNQMKFASDGMSPSMQQVTFAAVEFPPYSSHSKGVLDFNDQTEYLKQQQQYLQSIKNNPIAYLDQQPYSHSQQKQLQQQQMLFGLIDNQNAMETRDGQQFAHGRSNEYVRQLQLDEEGESDLPNEGDDAEDEDNQSIQDDDDQEMQDSDENNDADAYEEEEDEEGKIIPDFPSENDIVDENFVIDEFKSSSSSSSSSLSSEKIDLTVHGVRIKPSEKHGKESNKKAVLSAGKRAGVAQNIAGSGKQQVNTEEEELVQNNNSEWDESLNNSQDPRWRDQKSRDLFMFQQSSQSFQDSKDSPIRDNNRGGQNYSQNVPKVTTYQSNHKYQFDASRSMEDQRSSRQNSQRQQFSGGSNSNGRQNHSNIAGDLSDQTENDEEEIKNLKEIRDIESQYCQQQQQQILQNGFYVQQQPSSCSPLKSPLKRNTIQQSTKAQYYHYNNQMIAPNVNDEVTREIAAVLIQKVWKGYQTRRILHYHQQQFEDNDERGLVRYAEEGEEEDNDELTEEQEDQILRQQIMEYLIANNEEWTEDEFEDYFLNFKMKHALEKQRLKLVEKQQQQENLHRLEQQQQQQQQILATDEEGVLHSEDLLMDEDVYLKSAQRYKEMCQTKSQLVEEQVQINYDELMRAGSSKLSSVQQVDFDDNHFIGQNNSSSNRKVNNFENSRSNATSSEQKQQSALPSGLLYEDPYFSESQRSNYSAKIPNEQGVHVNEENNSSSNKESRFCIEDENGELIELDLSKLPGMESLHFKEQLLLQSDRSLKKKRSVNKEQQQVADVEIAFAEAHAERLIREMAFNQVQHVSMKRQMQMNLAAEAANEEEDENINGAQEEEEDNVEYEEQYIEEQSHRDNGQQQQIRSVVNEVSMISDLDVQAQSNSMVPSAEKQVAKRYNSYMENLALSAGNQESEAKQSSSQNSGFAQESESRESSKQVAMASSQVEDEDGEQEIEYEIDLDHLLAKSQFKDEDGNVFIVEQGQKIFLGEQELEMIAEYAMQKQLEQQQEEEQQYQQNSQEEEEESELLHKNQFEEDIGDHQLNQQDKEASVVDQEGGEFEELQDNEISVQKDLINNSQVEDNDSAVLNVPHQKGSEQEVNQERFNEQESEMEQIPTKRSEQFDEEQDQLSMKSPSPSKSNGVSHLIGASEQKTLSEVSAKSHLNTSQVSEVSKAMKEQAKQWSELMSMIEGQDSTNPQSIIEQIKMLSQQNLIQLTSEITTNNKSQLSEEIHTSRTQNEQVETVNTQQQQESERVENDSIISPKNVQGAVAAVVSRLDLQAETQTEEEETEQNNLSNEEIDTRINAVRNEESEYLSASQILQHHQRRTTNQGSVSSGRLVGIHPILDSFLPNATCSSTTGQHHQSLTPNHNLNHLQFEGFEDDGTSSTGGSVFEAAPFQEFTQKKFKEFLQHSSLIKLGQQVAPEEVSLEDEEVGDYQDEEQEQVERNNNNNKTEYEDSSIKKNQLSSSVSPNKMKRRYSGGDLNTKGSPRNRLNALSSPNGVHAIISPRAYDTHQVDLSLSQQRRASQNSLQMMQSASSSTSSIARTQRDMMFIQKMKQFAQEQSHNTHQLNGTATAAGESAQRFHINLGHSMNSPQNLPECLSGRNQYLNSSASATSSRASGQILLSQSSLPKLQPQNNNYLNVPAVLATANIVVAASVSNDVTVQSNFMHERAQQQRSNIVVIDSYKPVDLMKRKAPEVVSSNSDALLNGVASVATQHHRTINTDQGTSEEDDENIDNSIDSDQMLNEKLRALKLLEPTLNGESDDDQDDIEQDRREFEETYKNLYSTEKKSPESRELMMLGGASSNMSGDQYYSVEQQVALVEDNCLAEDDLLQETPKEDRVNEGILSLSEDKSIDTAGWASSVSSSQVFPDTPAQFSKQQSLQNQRIFIKNTTAVGAATVTAGGVSGSQQSNGVLHNLSSINWDKELLMSGQSTSEKKMPGCSDSLTIMQQIIQSVDTPIEQCHLSNSCSAAPYAHIRNGIPASVTAEPAVSDLYVNYHNNYSLVDEIEFASCPGISQTDDAFQQTTKEAQEQFNVQQRFLRNNQKLESRYLEDHSIDEGNQLAESRGSFIEEEEQSKNQLDSQSKDEKYNLKHEPSSISREDLDNSSGLSASGSGIGRAVVIYTATATAAPQPQINDENSYTSSRNHNRSSTPIVTVDDCCSEDNEINEPINMNQGCVLPHHDSIEDELPSVIPLASPKIPYQSPVDAEPSQAIHLENQNLAEKQKIHEADQITEVVLTTLVDEFALELSNHSEMQKGNGGQQLVYMEVKTDSEEDDDNYDYEDDDEEEGENHHSDEDDYHRWRDARNQVQLKLSSQLSLGTQPSTKLAQRMQGISTNIEAVKLYLGRLSKHIIDTYAESFLEKINISLGPSPIEMLKFLHFNDDTQSVDSNSQSAQGSHEGVGTNSSQLDTSTSDVSIQHQAVLTTELYSTFEMLLLEEKEAMAMADSNTEASLSGLAEKPDEISLYKISQKDITHIHNKVVFDALNESLDNHRVYGLKGKPFPWRIDSTKVHSAPITLQDIPVILQKAQSKVLEWAKFQCGILFDKPEQGTTVTAVTAAPSNQTEEQIHQQKKEKYLSNMLHAEIREAEEKWIIYDDEYTEIEVEIAEYVFDELLTQAALELTAMQYSALSS